MPNRNGTGPFGTGRAGRGFGPCGRAYRGWADEAEMLRKEKEAIERRLSELEKQQ